MFDGNTAIIGWCHLSLSENSWCIISCFEFTCIWHCRICTIGPLLSLWLLDLLVWSLWLLLVWKNHFTRVWWNMTVSITWFASILSVRNRCFLLSWLSQTAFSNLILLEFIHCVLHLSQCHTWYCRKIYIWLNFFRILDLLFTLFVCRSERLRLGHALILIPILDCTTLCSVVERVCSCMRTLFDSFVIFIRYVCFVEIHLLATKECV